MRKQKKKEEIRMHKVQRNRGTGGENKRKTLKSNVQSQIPQKVGLLCKM